jgi:hypothetical protein
VQFEEGPLKRLSSVDYVLVGDATQGTPDLAALYEGLTATATLGPDNRRRAAGSLTLDIPAWSPAPTACACGALRVEYFNLTLTNLTSGTTYPLERVSRVLPG